MVGFFIFFVFFGKKRGQWLKHCFPERGAIIPRLGEGFFCIPKNVLCVCGFPIFPFCFCFLLSFQEERVEVHFLKERLCVFSVCAYRCVYFRCMFVFSWLNLMLVFDGLLLIFC